MGAHNRPERWPTSHEVIQPRHAMPEAVRVLIRWIVPLLVGLFAGAQNARAGAARRGTPGALVLAGLEPRRRPQRHGVGASPGRLVHPQDRPARVEPAIDVAGLFT